MGITYLDLVLPVSIGRRGSSISGGRRRLWADIGRRSKLWCSKGGGSLWAQISGEGGLVHQRLLASDN